MTPLTITIDWVYFLGIFGILLTFAWAASGRFAKIETDIQWMKKLLYELKVGNDNKSADAFATHSPVSLTENGREILEGSGMKRFIDTNLARFEERAEVCRDRNPYQIQQYIFDTFDGFRFPEAEFKTFQQFAFDKGISMEIIRRVGALYFRDLYLKSLGHTETDIDKHTPSEGE